MGFLLRAPKLSFLGIHFDEGLLLTTYFAVALICSQLTALRLAADRAGLLAESERMHQTLFDSLSHEIMTPLAVFRSAVEQLGTPDAARRARVMVELRIAMQRLDGLVGNLLNQNRLESGVLKPTMDWCDVHDLVAAARRALGDRIGDHPLRVDIPPDMPICRVDAALMEQAIAQLLLNAAVHTPPAAGITVSAGLSAHSSRILITVADNGSGVPLEIRDKIFDKHTRGSNARKGGPGAGAVDRSRLHDGTGGPGLGRIPAGQGGAFHAFPAVREARCCAHRMKKERKSNILIVDDEEQIRRLLREALEEAGFAVREAESGRIALGEIALQPRT